MDSSSRLSATRCRRFPLSLSALLIAALTLFLGALTSAHAAAPLTNAQLTITPDSTGFNLTRQGLPAQRFDLRFQVFFTDKNPDLALRRGGVPGAMYNVPTWKPATPPAPEHQLVRIEKSAATAGDGFDDKILKGKVDNRVCEYWVAAPFTEVAAGGVTVAPNKLTWTFPAQPGFTLAASLELPADATAPILTWTLTPQRKGWYMVNYTGAAAGNPARAQEIWQPLIWAEQRFPDRSYLTAAYHCPIPTCFVTTGNVTYGVIADSSELPFEPLPTFLNSRFGVALRDSASQARPMVAAPILGGPGSLLEPGKTFSFKLRPYVARGTAAQAMESAARELFGFTDLRYNALGSLNATMENMLTYAMSQWGRFKEEEKGYSYETDAPGTVKNVSALNPLDLAIITDNEEIFRRRAYPYLEYMLSREKTLFTTNEAQKIQSPSYTLEGPCAPLSELAALEVIFNHASPVFIELGKSKYDAAWLNATTRRAPATGWTTSLYLYEATGDKQELARARAGADNYIKIRMQERQTDFTTSPDGGFFFWTSFAPKFPELYMLYRATGEKKYLDAAQRAARLFTQYIWLAPQIPSGDITVNKGGVAPLYSYLSGKGHPQMKVPEETAPAWRLSEIGLTCESCGTSAGHRAIFMANYAPWLVRIGHDAHDPFLTELARHAIIGRYRNFPGYHINTGRTTVYEKADYPNRPHEQLSYNSFHYNHIWPMISMLVDYMASTAETRSDGAIAFKPQFIEGYAYLKNYFYSTGGKFYDDPSVMLWMPAGLLKSSDDNVNYIAARGADALHFALMNEGAAALEATCTVNPALVPAVQGPIQAVLHGADGATSKLDIVNGQFKVKIPLRGLVAVTLQGVRVQPKFQDHIRDLPATAAWKIDNLKIPEFKAHALLLNLGSGYRRAYIYLESGKKDYKQLALQYTINGAAAQTLTDATFPFEFTVPLPAGATRLDFTLTATKPDGTTVAAKPCQLAK
jgi:hypothetical protein